MSERYSKLFALSENQYASGSPVVIAAGALLKDNQTGKVIAQLKLRNISSKQIKAATVCIVPFDTVGNPIGDSVSYQYLDLSAMRDEDFGQKAAIALPNAATRSFAATVEEIAFADNTIWKATGEPWEMMPVPSSIGRIYGAEFEKQFRMKYGADCKVLPLLEKNLWYCTCGVLNHKEEQVCHSCKKSFAVLSSIDYDALNEEKELRVAHEKETAKVEEQIRAKKTKRAILITSIVVFIIIAVSVCVSFIQNKNNAKTEEDFKALMSVSMLEASELIDEIKNPSAETKAMIEVYEKYAPYCGTFAWKDMSGNVIDMFSFESDFYLDGDSVYWVYDDSEYEFLTSFNAFYANPNKVGETYQFLRKPLLADNMNNIIERIEDDIAFLWIKLEDEAIITNYCCYDNYIQGNEFIVEEGKWGIVFTLEAVKK